MRTVPLWISSLLVVVLLAACGGGQTSAPESEAENAADASAEQAEAPEENADEAAGDEAAAEPLAEPLNVVATTGQIADTVAQIAEDNVELVNLLGPGIDPHTYVATEGDLQTFQEADVIFYNGLHLEAQMERVLEQIGEGDVTVVAVADSLDPITLLNWEPEAGLPYDPHVWNDIRLWTEVMYVIRDTLMEADPANAATYEANAEAYAQELEELHTYTLDQIEQIPQEQRVLVTAHDAFGYYGRAYGLAVEAVQGISTESEASTADIQALTDVILEREVSAIFIETTISPRTIEAVQQAVQADGQEVDIGGSLYSDAMGEPGSGADTYAGMMRHNIDTIVSALSS